MTNEVLTIAPGAEEEFSTAIDIQGDRDLVVRLNGDVDSTDLTVTPLGANSTRTGVGPVAVTTQSSLDNPPTKVTNLDISGEEDVYLLFSFFTTLVRASLRVQNDGGAETSVYVELSGTE
jgi:hypothetical protein